MIKVCEVCGKQAKRGILCEPCRIKAQEHWQIIRGQMERDGIAIKADEPEAEAKRFDAGER